MIFKVDFAKDYDSLSWEYPLGIMKMLWFDLVLLDHGTAENG